MCLTAGFGNVLVGFFGCRVIAIGYPYSFPVGNRSKGHRGCRARRGSAAGAGRR